MYYVYWLKARRDGRVHYVGITNNPQRRLSEHMADTSDTPRGRWLRSVGYRVQMETLGAVHSRWQAGRIEHELIDIGQAFGWPLTNTVGMETAPYDVGPQRRPLPWGRWMRKLGRWAWKEMTR